MKNKINIYQGRLGCLYLHVGDKVTRLNKDQLDDLSLDYSFIKDFDEYDFNIFYGYPIKDKRQIYNHILRLYDISIPHLYKGDIYLLMDEADNFDCLLGFGKWLLSQGVSSDIEIEINNILDDFEPGIVGPPQF